MDTVSPTEGVPAEAFEALRDIAHRGWLRGLLAGFNGNLSLRLGDRVALTCSGSAKGHLTPADVTLVDLADGRTLCPGCPSVEAGLHLAVYRASPEAGAVVHTHPPHLLALSLLAPPGELLRLPLVESAIYLPRLAQVPPLPAGSAELAAAVGAAAADRPAVFMQRHGLVCRGRDLVHALALSEELEGLARVHWMVLAAGGDPRKGEPQA
jgi:L-fuculose-phosphate aldolase